MYSYACAWTDGVERWSVFHDPNQGIKHLEASGNLPAEMQPIRDQLFSQQDEGTDNHTDYVFDVPVELFAALGGIRYDRDIPGAGPEPWEVLNRPVSSSLASRSVILIRARLTAILTRRLNH